MKFIKLTGLVASALFLAGCHTLTVPFSTSNATGDAASHASVALSIVETHPLQGSDKVSVHAYSYTRGSDHCSRTIALKFSSTLPYTQTLIALRNRALVTGANAISITDWREHLGVTTLTGHFFDCHSKKGL